VDQDRVSEVLEPSRGPADPAAVTGVSPSRAGEAEARRAGAEPRLPSVSLSCCRRRCRRLSCIAGPKQLEGAFEALVTALVFQYKTWMVGDNFLAVLLGGWSGTAGKRSAGLPGFDAWPLDKGSRTMIPHQAKYRTWGLQKSLCGPSWCKEGFLFWVVVSNAWTRCSAERPNSCHVAKLPKAAFKSDFITW